MNLPIDPAAEPLIAITVEDHKRWGCVKCGYDQVDTCAFQAQDGKARVAPCHNCGAVFAIVINRTVKTVVDQLHRVYVLATEHPRWGARKHHTLGLHRVSQPLASR